MTVNDFCTKVNLPKFCARLGVEGYSFVKLPTFGWYAYNNDRSVVANIFDLVKFEERAKLYQLVAKDKREYLDFEFNYSTMTEVELNNNYVRTSLWQAAFNIACEEFQTYKVTFQGKKVLLKTVLAENGFAALTKMKIGVMTKKLKRTFNMLSWDVDCSNDLGRLIIPTYYTPKHIATLETCSWDNPTRMYPLYNVNEKGWYGDITEDNVLRSPANLWTDPGFTWDYKCDFWTANRIKKLSNGLYADNLINIWVESKNTAFSQSPLDKIIEQNQTDELKNYIGKLSFAQLEEVEQKTGVKLAECWKRAKESQMQLGKHTYVRRDNAYFRWGTRNEELVPLTNFALDLLKIVKKDGKFYRQATLYIGNKSADIELPDSCFHSFRAFSKAVREAGLNAGIGITVWHSTQGQQTLNAIESFNAVNVDIESESCAIQRATQQEENRDELQA